MENGNTGTNIFTMVQKLVNSKRPINIILASLGKSRRGKKRLKNITDKLNNVFTLLITSNYKCRINVNYLGSFGREKFQTKYS